MTPAEVIEAELANIHPCTCIPAYKERGLVDPQCVGCEVEGDGIDIVAALVEHGFLPAEGHSPQVQEVIDLRKRRAERADG